MRGSFDGPSEAYQHVTRQRRGRCPELPADLLSRAEQLASATLVHIPKKVRENLCAIFSDCLEGVLDGDSAWSVLAQCSHRLLLAAVPKGIRPEDEISRRLTLWHNNSIEALMLRVEQQSRSRAGDVTRIPSECAQKHTTRRAVRLAREGARGKAVRGLSGGPIP